VTIDIALADYQFEMLRVGDLPSPRLVASVSSRHIGETDSSVSFNV
jgi:hypothetical protein